MDALVNVALALLGGLALLAFSHRKVFDRLYRRAVFSALSLATALVVASFGFVIAWGEQPWIYALIGGAFACDLLAIWFMLLDWLSRD